MCSTAAALSVTSIVGTAAKMAANQNDSNYQSKELKREAEVARAQGIEQERQVREKAAREQARRRVNVLKGGVTTEGSPTDMLVDAARVDDIEARWARFDKDEAARSKEREARFRRRQSMIDQFSENNALGADLIRLADMEKSR